MQVENGPSRQMTVRQPERGCSVKPLSASACEAGGAASTELRARGTGGARNLQLAPWWDCDGEGGPGQCESSSEEMPGG